MQGIPAARIAQQAVFYLQRLPDQITGPFVEVGTVFQRSRAPWGSGQFLGGRGDGRHDLGIGDGAADRPRRRLAGLVAFTTLALLLVWPFTEAGRFLIPLVPFLLVGATEGLARLMALAGIRRPRDWAVGIVLVVSVPYAAYAVVTGRAAAQRRTHADFDAACQWICPAGRPSRARHDPAPRRSVLADEAVRCRA